MTTECSDWPKRGDKMECNGEGDATVLQDAELDIHQTERCETLCKQEAQNGCCMLKGSSGCFWKNGRSPIKRFGSIDSQDEVSTHCVFFNDTTSGE